MKKMHKNRKRLTYLLMFVIVISSLVGYYRVTYMGSLETVTQGT